MANDRSLGAAAAAFDFESQAGAMQVLASVRASDLPKEAKNELRDLVFLYINGGRDTSVRLNLEQKLQSFNVQPVALPKTDTPIAQPEYEFGTSRPAPSFSPPSVTPVPRSAPAPQPEQQPAPQPKPVAMTSPESETESAPSNLPTESAETPASTPVEVTPSPPLPRPEPKEQLVPPTAAPTPEPVVEPVESESSVSTKAAPVPESPSATSDGPAPTSAPRETQSGLTADQYLQRIREIKAEVNERVGNPVNLVDIDNVVGREYMLALLEAMKKVNGGGTAAPAMDRLEVAFTAVNETLDKHEAETSASASGGNVPPPPPVAPKPQDTPAPKLAPEDRPAPPHSSQPEAKHDSAPMPAPPVAPVSASPPSAPKPTPVKKVQVNAAPKPEPSENAPENTAPTTAVTPPKVPAPPTSKSVTEPPKPEPEVAPEPPKPQPQPEKPPTPTPPPVTTPGASAESSDSADTPPPAVPAGAPAPRTKNLTPKEIATAWGPETDTLKKQAEERGMPDDSATGAPTRAVPLAESKTKLRTPDELPLSSSIDTSSVAGDPLYTRQVDDGLDQLLSEWSLFKKSGIFGTGPKGREHPLFQKIKDLQIPLLLAGRFEGATQEIKQSITDYMNGWRYEQGIIYEQGETFEHYLRRVIRHILDLQKNEESVS